MSKVAPVIAVFVMRWTPRAAAFRVACRDDQIRAFGASAPRCFEADA
jgi:hypothetical protein